MKTKLLLMTFAFVFASKAQLDDGTYHFSDKKNYKIDLTVCEGGEGICNFAFYENEKEIVVASYGEWFRVNSNGVEEDYEGPWGWYQIEIDDEYFEIEVLSSDKIKVLRGETELFLFKME